MSTETILKPAMLEITHCSKCPHFEAIELATSDSWERAFNWMCNKEKKKIQGYVEWFEESKIEVPDWCPLRK